ncbi:unnamed protein product [Rhizoctonia solani]|uniref:Heat shock 70 kDa protein 12A n=1 Tax=Rhizoctonia solani TaxID=456999 RepID=A0A8H3AGA8_9AGAM|nr:unnamed protein product [Rhizoctonia solani]
MSIDAAPKPFRGPWEGDTKIVIGIDIGSTQSGVAFAFLQNGASQAIHRVTRWPGQEAHNQQGKIPTLVWYDTNRRAMSFGAEALLHTTEEQAEDNGWVLAKYFKLHLHPSDMRAKHELKLDPLPPGITLRQIYSDFLGYLLKHTRAYFEDRILDGRQLWERYSSTMEIVIAHPNGWGIREQAFLRSAAVSAGFSTADQAPAKVRFVTEAEASVHFCIHHTNLGNVLQPGTNFAVCDAGGSTVDTTLYSVISARPVLKLEEKWASACVQAGAIFVDFEAEKFLRRTLTGAGLSSDDVVEYTKAGVKDFEGFAKRAFKDETTEQSVAVAHTRFNNTSIRARRGRMTLSGPTIKSFFDVCVKEITGSVDQQLAGFNVPYVLLVGGFGDSPYVRSEFKKRYEPRGSRVTLTNDSTSKAVADGAVIWSTLSSVYFRAPRYSFGTDASTLFNPFVHPRQGRTSYTCASGEEMVAGIWSQIVQKGVALDAESVCRESYCHLYSTANPDLELYTFDLLAYSGDDKPDWALSPNGMVLPRFQNACTIRGNLKNLQGALKSAVGSHGSYWTLNYDVCIRFGGTELEGYMEWEERRQLSFPKFEFRDGYITGDCAMPGPFHGPWRGRNKILLSIDIGLTHSSVSFAYLEKGANQTLHPVTKWPGQGVLNPEGLIPTLVWYDANNEAVAFGAEAQLRHIEEQAENSDWFLAKKLKAQLYPEDTGARHNPRISALPFGVSLRQVYTDFLGYLLKHTKSFFEDRFVDGVQIWERYKPTMEVVMNHPNEWGAREQTFLRDVIVRAGYTTSDMATNNIRFVTDTDASAYCYLSNASLANSLRAGDLFLLCDAGATTTNVSLHRIDSTYPILGLHTCNSERLEGGISLVDIEAEKYIRQTMANVGISTEDADTFTRGGIGDFKKHVKFSFSDETKEYLIQISDARFNHPALSTRRGRMALPGYVAHDPSVFYNSCGAVVDGAFRWDTSMSGSQKPHQSVSVETGKIASAPSGPSPVTPAPASAQVPPTGPSQRRRRRNQARRQSWKCE